ncbi:MAG TPA: hypothetical protein VKZ50_17100 [bacterium]|nr:hypothetical protein [bacterium]
MKGLLAVFALVAIAALAPALAVAQSTFSPTGPTENTKGIIAKIQSIACATANQDSCRTQLVITAGPTSGSQTPGHPVATVAPITVLIMPQTPIMWTRFNRTVKPNQLKPGDAVDIDYHNVGGVNVATRVNVSLQ